MCLKTIKIFLLNKDYVTLIIQLELPIIHAPFVTYVIAAMNSRPLNHRFLFLLFNQTKKVCEHRCVITCLHT